MQVKIQSYKCRGETGISSRRSEGVGNAHYKYLIEENPEKGMSKSYAIEEHKCSGCKHKGC